MTIATVEKGMDVGVAGISDLRRLKPILLLPVVDSKMEFLLHLELSAIVTVLVHRTLQLLSHHLQALCPLHHHQPVQRRAQLQNPQLSSLR